MLVGAIIFIVIRNQRMKSSPTHSALPGSDKRSDVKVKYSKKTPLLFKMAENPCTVVFEHEWNRFVPALPPFVQISFIKIVYSFTKLVPNCGVFEQNIEYLLHCF